MRSLVKLHFATKLSSAAAGIRKRLHETVLNKDEQV